jgi:endo-1,3-1,4-beta-glycanase ExoK
MEMKKIIILISVIVVLLAMGCDVAGSELTQSENSDSRAVQTWNLWEPMDWFNTSVWNKANWANNGFFNCGWNPNNAYFSNGKLVLKLDNTWSNGYPYSGGEYRTNNTFSYGYFETNMKAVAKSGTVTAFFLYTGSPWDEIDFEVLGKNTWQVQLNYFVNGVGGHEKIINLGFDASQGFHKYGIEYGNGYINWYIDGNWVYGVNNQGFNANWGAAMPSHPMQIMVHHWPGTGVDGWLGSYYYGGPTYAEYDYILYRP